MNNQALVINTEECKIPRRISFDLDISDDEVDSRSVITVPTFETRRDVISS